MKKLKNSFVYLNRMEQLMTCGIYAIRNLTTNKVYVGKSINIEIRFAGHKSMLRSEVRSRDCNRYLYNAFKKYGENDFVFEISTENIIKCLIKYYKEI